VLDPISRWVGRAVHNLAVRRPATRSAVSARRDRKLPRPSARPFLEPLETRLTPSFVLTTLASFNGANGNGPDAGLMMDNSGNLYGTTAVGGQYGNGSVFEIANGSGVITTLASFNGNSKTVGYRPLGGVIMDSSGNLYGTTYMTGGSQGGSVFEIAHGSGTLTALATFTRGTSTGAGPRGNLIMDGSGNLYGTTQFGGGVFELAAGSGTITTLASFNGSNGDDPYAGPLMDSAGNLYGTADDGNGGGPAAVGSVFEVAKGSGTITDLAYFNTSNKGTNGGNPDSALIMDSSGNLYGTTSNWGPFFPSGSGGGTIF
jgi:uncharacterized repeat protein (TIGR03803 family)